MHALVALSVLPKNGPEIHLGPGHPAVQYLWADLITRKGHLMSEVPIVAVPIAVEAVTVSERMALLVYLKTEAAVLAGKAGSLLAGSAQTIQQTLHLDAGANYVRSAGSFLRGKAAGVAALVGRGGVIGAAMMALSTTGGRKFIKALTVSPIAWAATKIGHGYCLLEDKIGTDKKVGGFRNWVSGRMAAVRRTVEDVATSIVKSRFVTKAAHLLRVDGPLMKVVRGIGAISFVWSVLAVSSASGTALIPSFLLGSFVLYAATKYVVKPICSSPLTVKAVASINRSLDESEEDRNAGRALREMRVAEAQANAAAVVIATVETQADEVAAASTVEASGSNAPKRSNGRSKPVPVV